MMFIRNINLSQLSNQKRLQIILVDHNIITSYLNDFVIEIIDHHQKTNGIKLKEY